MSLKVFCGQEQNAIDYVHKFGESLLKTVVVTSAKDGMTYQDLFSDSLPRFIIAEQSVQSRYQRQDGEQTTMEALLSSTFQVRDVNDGHRNMVHIFLLDKNDGIVWDNDGTPPTDRPDNDDCGDVDQHDPSMSLGNDDNHDVRLPDHDQSEDESFAVKSIDDVAKLTWEHFVAGLCFETRSDLRKLADGFDDDNL